MITTRKKALPWMKVLFLFLPLSGIYLYNVGRLFLMAMCDVHPSLKQNKESDSPTHESPKAPPEGFERIYYMDSATSTARRSYMESWLSRQDTPYERIEAVYPDLNATNDRDPNCVPNKSDPLRCREIRGLIHSNFRIINEFNTSGMTFVLQDGVAPRNDANVNAFVKRVEKSVRLVPNDWDIIRLDCRGDIPSNFVPPVSESVFRTAHDPERSCQEGEECWFCGGVDAQIWRGGSIDKLRSLWSKVPFDDMDCLLTSHEINSYCVNAGLVVKTQKRYTSYHTTSEEHVTYLHELLSVIVDILNEHNIPYFLESGTLLGAMRNNPPGMMKWDDDIDLGVRDSDYDRMYPILSNDTRLVHLWASFGLKYGLAKKDSYPYNADIFRYRHMTHNGGDPRWYVYDAREKRVDGVEYYFEDNELETTVPCAFWDLTLACPKGSISYLSRTYGSNVMTIAQTYSHTAQPKHYIQLEEEDLNDHAAFLPALNKELKDKLLPNTNRLPP